MTGKWFVKDMRIDGKRQFVAARKLDADKPEGSENLEYKGQYSPRRESVQALVDLLNAGDFIS